MSRNEQAGVIIVGAGPAGATCARILAEQGLNVTIVDRANFPRYKTCGGGIIGATSHVIPAGFPARDSIRVASFSFRGKMHRLCSSDRPFMHTVVRAEFDNWLLGCAVAAGAEFRPNTLVNGFYEVGSQVVVQTDSGDCLADFVIDASGTSSRIARKVGVSLQEIDLGLEVEVQSSGSTKWLNRVHIDWGPIPGSYGWLFPKGDSYTVGVIGSKQYSSELRSYLDDLLRDLGLADCKVIKRSGHLTRCRSLNSPVGEGNVLLVGDAAGLLEPWTREGISFAVRSAELAAETIISSVSGQSADNSLVSDYARRLEKTLISEMESGFALLAAFRKYPRIFHMLVSGTGIGWRQFKRISRGETSFARAFRHRSVRFIFTLLSK